MQEIQLLSKKLDVLLDKYKDLKAENKRLKTTAAQQLQMIEALNKKLSTAEQQLTALQLNRAMRTEREKLDLRKQLDTVIGEIDKILNTLND